jgi:redox-sensitive bicupin YhaK (pirin superfamily)
VGTTVLAPEIRVVRAAARRRTETSWLDSWHCFNYGRHYEPDNTHHGLLVVCNDDRVRGSTGFGQHAHQEMEIVTWMVEGELEHRDAGGAHVLYPGLVRRLSAGRGIRHAEMNPAGWAPCRYIEMWVPPDTGGLDPGAEVADVSGILAGGGLVPVASGPGHARGTGGVPLTEAAAAARDSAVSLRQAGAVLWAGRLQPDEAAAVPDGPHVHLFVALGDGVLDTGGLAGAGKVYEGDSVRLVAAGSPVFTAGNFGAELLVWETA